MLSSSSRLPVLIVFVSFKIRHITRSTRLLYNASTESSIFFYSAYGHIRPITFPTFCLFLLKTEIMDEEMYEKVNGLNKIKGETDGTKKNA